MAKKKQQSQQQEYPFHPLANEYPLMGEAELERLADSIRENGLLYKVIVWNGQVIDGRNRLLACVKYSIPCQFEDSIVEEKELPSLIDALNEHRRHLTIEFLKARRDERIKRAIDAKKAGKSQREIAKDEGVDEKTIRKDLSSAHGADQSADRTPDFPANTPISERDQRVLDAHGEGKSLRVIAKEEGIAASTVHEIIARTKEKLATSPAPEPTPIPPTKPEPASGHLPGFDDPEPEEAKPLEFTLVDGWDIPIQPHAQAAFADVPKFTELLKAIRHAEMLFNQLANSEGGKFLTLPDVSSYRRGSKGEDGEHADRFVHPGLERAKKQIKAAIPTYTVCPYNYVDAPHPDPCNTCRGLNWTPELGKSIPPSAIARAKEAHDV